MSMSTRELVDYYANLLIFQYLGKSKAYKTVQGQVNPIVLPLTSVQQISFSITPTAGAFVLSYAGVNTSSLAWNATAAQIQTALRLISGLSLVSVTGSIASKTLTVTFDGVTSTADLLTVASSTLTGAASAVASISILEIDDTLPIAVQNAFNILPGTTIAKGVHLDIIGKYAGVTRAGRGFGSFIQLNDADYILLIRAAIGRNYSGSTLPDIQRFLATYFPGQIFVYDYANMHLGYFISPGSISSDLLQTFIGQGLLPKPMGVSISPIIYTQNNKLLFGFRSYDRVNPFASPFNNYSSYDTNVAWLSYANVITV